MSFTEEIIEINEAIAANGIATVNVTYSDRNGSYEAIVYVHEVCPAGLDIAHADATEDFIPFGFIESINVLDEAPAPEKAEEAKDEEAPNGYVVKRDSDKAVISRVFTTYNEASEELSRIARDGEEEGWMYVWEVEVSPACICGPTKTAKQALAPYCGEVCRRKAQDESLKRQNLRPTSWTDGNWAGE